MISQDLLVVEGVKIRLGRTRVLQDVNLRCQPGEVVALLGGNGAGKSTLLRIISGQLRPDAGSVQVRGHQIGGGSRDAREYLGFSPDGQQPLPDLSVGEFLSFVRCLKGGRSEDLRAATSRSDELGVTELIHRSLTALSLGQKKRVLLLAALFRDPPLLVLDEPAIGLDPIGTEALHCILQERKSQGLVTLFASNDSSFTSQAMSTCYRLSQGQLVQEQANSPTDPS